MKKITLLLGVLFLFAGISTAQDCPDGNAGNTSVRFTGLGKLYMEWGTNAQASQVYSNLTIGANPLAGIVLNGTANGTGAAINNFQILDEDLTNPSGNQFRIRSDDTPLFANGGTFTGTITYTFQNGTTLVCSFADGVLPITLSEFSAKPASKSVMINWRTTAELNNDYMAVERSADGRTFQEIGRQLGAGYSVSLQEYKLEDTNPARGTNYYRLRQVDFDGTESYSHIVQTSFDGKSHNGQLDIYPTAITGSDELTVDLSAFSAGDIQLEIYNMNGQLVQEYQSYGSEKIVLPVTDFEKGFYVLKVADGYHTAIGRFMKVH